MEFENDNTLAQPVPMRRRTLNQVQAELEPLGFPFDVCVSIWHRCNGRIEEAEEYFETYMQEEKAKRLAMKEATSKKMAEMTEAVRAHENMKANGNNE